VDDDLYSTCTSYDTCRSCPILCRYDEKQNVLNAFSMVMGAFVLAFIVWIVAGYSLAFGTNSSTMLQNVVGEFSHILLSGIS